MYCLSEEQIEYILNDIRRNGIEMEDLQLNLLDHICCIVEQGLKENDDFESFYHRTIKQFYKKELHEIEEETINLLTFKNYYAMKKLMIISGIFSSVAFVFGSWFKITHWPGASVLLVSAILVFSLIFLPLLFLLKSKEGAKRDRLILGIGTIVGILYSLSMLFGIQHIKYRQELWLTTLGIAFFVFLPIYYFTGIRNAATKANTIVSSVLLMGFLGIQFTMTGLNRIAPRDQVYTYLKSEQLLEKVRHSNNMANNKQVADIQNACEKIKSVILNKELGMPAIPADFENRQIVFKEKHHRHFFQSPEGIALMDDLRAQVTAYNAASTAAEDKIPFQNSVLDAGFADQDFCGNLFVLNNITQLQLLLATSEQKLIAGK